MTYITPKDYFAGHADDAMITDTHRANAAALLLHVNGLLGDALKAGVFVASNPTTKSLVSGQTDGGWRPQISPVGAPASAHKQGQAVDVYDPDGSLDDWITDKILEFHGLFREHPAATRGWVHLTTRAPGSGKRTFYP